MVEEVDEALEGPADGRAERVQQGGLVAHDQVVAGRLALLLRGVSAHSVQKVLHCRLHHVQVQQAYKKTSK